MIETAKVAVSCKSGVNFSMNAPAFQNGRPSVIYGAHACSKTRLIHPPSLGTSDSSFVFLSDDLLS